MTIFSLSTPRLLDHRNGFAFTFSVPRFGDFTETVVFPDRVNLREMDASLRDDLACLAAIPIGASYYKAAPAERIAPEFAMTASGRHLTELVYGPGLGEFYVRNALGYPPCFTIAADVRGDAAKFPVFQESAAQAAVAFGGGKDSHVAANVIRAAGVEPEYVSLVLSERVSARLQGMSETPVTMLHRTIDPRLIEISRSGEALNGHIPITGINSCLMMLYAAAKGLDWVVFANERDASEPTMEANGYSVNHQFSKSLEFENALRDGFMAAGAPVQYFSVLRPVSALWIGRYLATKAAGALDIFASCNRNFVFAGPDVLEEGRRWCGRCSKCVYTAVLLAPFLSVIRHAEVFQGQPLHDPDNARYLREIAGLTGAKPWECVGERREVACTITHLLSHPEWSKVPLIKAIEPELFIRWDRDRLRASWSEGLDARSEHRMPTSVAAIMGAD